jgi:hypothetical protein
MYEYIASVVLSRKKVKPLIPDETPSNHKISTEVIQAEDEILPSGIQKHINSIWNKEGLRYQWKTSIIVPMYELVDGSDCSNYCAISLL